MDFFTDWWSSKSYGCTTSNDPSSLPDTITRCSRTRYVPGMYHKSADITSRLRRPGVRHGNCSQTVATVHLVGHRAQIRCPGGCPGVPLVLIAPRPSWRSTWCDTGCPGVVPASRLVLVRPELCSLCLGLQVATAAVKLTGILLAQAYRL